MQKKLRFFFLCLVHQLLTIVPTWQTFIVVRCLSQCSLCMHAVWKYTVFMLARFIVYELLCVYAVTWYKIFDFSIWMWCACYLIYDFEFQVQWAPFNTHSLRQIHKSVRTESRQCERENTKRCLDLPISAQWALNCGFIVFRFSIQFSVFPFRSLNVFGSAREEIMSNARIMGCGPVFSFMRGFWTRPTVELHEWIV